MPGKDRLEQSRSPCVQNAKKWPRGASGFHRRHDMRGVGRVRKAGRPAAGADSGLVEKEKQGLGFDSVERDVRRVRETQRRMAVEFSSRDRGENPIAGMSTDKFRNLLARRFDDPFKP